MTNTSTSVTAPSTSVTAPSLYIFLDEGGNFDFSPSGTKYFTLTCASLLRPFSLHTELDTFKYDLLEHRIKPRISIDHFHCTEDNTYVRKKVFDMLSVHVPPNSVDSIIVEKRKTGPALQPPEKFYPKMLGYLLRYAIDKAPKTIGEVVVITDRIPVQKKKKAIEKGIKSSLPSMLPKGTPYRLMHHASAAHYGLQVADYFNWAIFRKWERKDATSYSGVRSQIRTEFDIFRSGTRHYY